MNFNGKFWHKPGHLGMTRAELKEALAGGAAIPETSSDDAGKILVIDDEGKIVVQKVFTVELTESGGVYSTTATPNEVTEHYQKGEKINVSVAGLDYYDFPFYIQPDGIFVPAPVLLVNTSVYPGGVIMFDILATPNRDNPYVITVHLIAFAT